MRLEVGRSVELGATDVAVVRLRTWKLGSAGGAIMETVTSINSTWWYL